MTDPRSSASSCVNAAVIALGLILGAWGAREHAAEASSADKERAGAEERLSGRSERPAPRYDEIGVASWYGPRHHGRRTASGALFDMHALTAAHRFLPLGTALRVENLANGRSVELRITDRGPYVEGRIIDLSLAAARRLDLEDQGVGLVGLTILPSDAIDAEAIAP